MGFEGLDSLLGNVTTMVVGGDKLVRHMVFLDHCLEFRGTLIIEHMMLGIYSSLLEAIDEALICPYHFASHPIFHCSNKDSAAIDVDKDHDV
jgi:hypothetical protein